jgi:hypothetical protein
MPEPAGVTVLFHGTRSNYVQGCRCDKCRAANSEYCKERRKNKPRRKTVEDTVDATRAREFLSLLSEAGVGRNSVNKVCGVGKRLIREIVSGKTKRILCSTENRILAVKANEALAHGANVEAEVAIQQIKALLAEGFTRGDIADRIHRFSDRLRIGEGRKIRMESALKINKLYQELMPADRERNEFIDAA